MAKRLLSLLFFISTTSFLQADTASKEEGYVINFEKVSMRELIKFVSKITSVNFIADDSLLDFDVTFASTKPSSKEEVLQATLDLIQNQNLGITNKGTYYFIEELPPEESPAPEPLIPIKEVPIVETEEKLAVEKVGKFTVCKLKYHPGAEILTAVKQIASDLVETGAANKSILSGIRSMQWMKSTNSLFFTAEEHVTGEIVALIESLDIPIKQVMIEVLVIETSMHSSLDFGLELSAGSKFKNAVGSNAASFPPAKNDSSFAQAMETINAVNTPNGPADFSMGKGSQLGIIGDIIFHKGKSFCSLGALLSALQTDGKVSIVLNQKVITQENKRSKIFVGNNIPFAGSVVQTVGASQQTTSNIEYKDIGVSLNITPMISDSEMITLEIDEEITETLDHLVEKSQHISGIETSKTNMMTNVHVPDRHFLILSGMTRTKRANSVSAPPCLGGIPLLGSLFSKKSNNNDKSSILIFVRPHIIHSQEQYVEMSDSIDIKASGQKISLDKLSQEGH